VNELSDEILMFRVKSGYIDYMADLFLKYSNQILNYFCYMTGKIEDSKDLTQDLFLRLIKYRKSFDPGKSFKSWIFQIARHMFINYSKSVQLNCADYESTGNIEEDKAGHSNSHVNDILLYYSILKLPDEYRELLILGKFHRIKYKDLAALFSITESAVKKKMLRALNKLREIYFKTENNSDNEL
jgi:RNA polymerase sigma factor (sigma-70 family)